MRLTPTTVGVKHGLTVFLDAEVNEYTYNSFHSAGFKVLWSINGYIPSVTYNIIGTASPVVQTTTHSSSSDPCTYLVFRTTGE